MRQKVKKGKKGKGKNAGETGRLIFTLIDTKGQLLIIAQLTIRQFHILTYHAKDHASIVWSVCSNSKSVLFLVNMASFSTQMFVTLLGRLVRACLLRTAVSWNETVYLAASLTYRLT